MPILLSRFWFPVAGISCFLIFLFFPPPSFSQHFGGEYFLTAFWDKCFFLVRFLYLCMSENAFIYPPNRLIVLFAIKFLHRNFSSAFGRHCSNVFSVPGLLLKSHMPLWFLNFGMWPVFSFVDDCRVLSFSSVSEISVYLLWFYFPFLFFPFFFSSTELLVDFFLFRNHYFSF